MTDTITILGKVATDPVQGQTSGGIPVTNFRLASTHRRYDATTQTWVDAGTNWYTVAAFRHLGAHAKSSLRSGDSVIVTGRLKIRNWESNGKHGTSVDIDAETIGHDLRWGTSAYARSVRSASVENWERVSADVGDSALEQEADAEHEIDAEEAMALSEAVWTAPDISGPDASETVPADSTPF